MERTGRMGSMGKGADTHVEHVASAVLASVDAEGAAVL